MEGVAGQQRGTSRTGRRICVCRGGGRRALRRPRRMHLCDGSQLGGRGLAAEQQRGASHHAAVSMGAAGSLIVPPADHAAFNRAEDLGEGGRRGLRGPTCTSAVGRGA